MSKENIIVGIHPIIEALKAGKEVEKVLIQQDIKGAGLTELRKAIKQAKVPYTHVPIQKLNKISKVNHQGVIAFTSAIETADIETLLPTFFEKEKAPLLLLLDRVTDVRNFGAIARTAECVGVDAIIVPKRESAQINEIALKTSAGALNKIPVCKVDNLTDAVMFLQASDVKVFCCTEKTEDTIYASDYTGPTAIVMGNEEKGVSNQILKITDGRAKIPMVGDISSLNVSVATAVILYEALKQRLGN